MYLLYQYYEIYLNFITASCPLEIYRQLITLNIQSLLYETAGSTLWIQV